MKLVPLFLFYTVLITRLAEMVAEEHHNSDNHHTSAIFDVRALEVDDKPLTTETSNSNSNWMNNVKLDHSRQIRLPDDYNKLDIPKMSKVKLKNLKGYWREKYPPKVEDEDAYFEPDEGQEDNLNVEVDVNIRSIRDFDEFQESITVELDFVAKWTDVVIMMENSGSEHDVGIKDMVKNIKSLDPIFLKKVWKPDLLFENVVSISRPELVSIPMRLLFHPSGLFIFATRVTVKMDCGMQFDYYPADTQECVFSIRSYSYTTKDLDIQWDVPGPFLLARKHPNYDFKLDMMDSYDLVEAEGLLGDDYNETYRIIQFKISVRRRLSYHLLQTYIPSAFFIIITWLSFLVPPDLVEARIGISMTTLLTLISMFSSVRESTPIVSYIKAIDIWVVACIFFVFLTLLEFTVLTWRRGKQKAATVGEHENEDTLEKNPDNNTIHHKREEPLQPIRTFEFRFLGRRRLFRNNDALSNGTMLEDDVERYCFITLSFLFVFFNLVYWSWIMLASNYFDFDVDFTYNIKDE